MILRAAVGKPGVQRVRERTGARFRRWERQGASWYTSELEARTNSGTSCFRHASIVFTMALHTHFEDGFGLAVEPFGAVDRGQVAQAVHAPGGLPDGVRIPNVRRDEFHVIPDVRQTAGATRDWLSRTRTLWPSRADAGPGGTMNPAPPVTR